MSKIDKLLYGDFTSRNVKKWPGKITKLYMQDGEFITVLVLMEKIGNIVNIQ